MTRAVRELLEFDSSDCGPALSLALAIASEDGRVVKCDALEKLLPLPPVAASAIADTTWLHGRL